MRSVKKELLYLFSWLSAASVLVPALLWWLASRGIVVVPGLEQGTLQASYLNFFHHLHEPLILAAVVFPYLLFTALRLLVGGSPPAGSTELGLAVTRGEPDLVQQMIARGEDLNQTNAAGETPLHLAAMQGDMGMASLLLESGADLNATDHAIGYTPLQLAALQGHSEICEMLIKYGAGVDAVTSRHETALHLAARAEHTAVIAVLLKYRANTGIKNNTGETALQIAEQSGNTALVSLMKQHASSEWPYLSLSNG